MLDIDLRYTADTYPVDGAMILIEVDSFGATSELKVGFFYGTQPSFAKIKNETNMIYYIHGGRDSWGNSITGKDLPLRWDYFPAGWMTSDLINPKYREMPQSEQDAFREFLRHFFGNIEKQIRDSSDSSVELTAMSWLSLNR